MLDHVALNTHKTKFCTTHTHTHTHTGVLLSVAPYGWMEYTHKQEHVVCCTIWVNGLHTQTGA